MNPLRTALAIVVGSFVVMTVCLVGIHHDEKHATEPQKVVSDVEFETQFFPEGDLSKQINEYVRQHPELEAISITPKYKDRTATILGFYVQFKRGR